MIARLFLRHWARQQRLDKENERKVCACVSACVCVCVRARVCVCRVVPCGSVWLSFMLPGVVDDGDDDFG